MRDPSLVAALLLALLVSSYARAAQPPLPAIEFRVGPFASDVRDWTNEALVNGSALTTLGGGKIPDALGVVEVDADGKVLGSSLAQIGPDATPWKNPESNLRSIAWCASGITAKGKVRCFQLRTIAFGENSPTTRPIAVSDDGTHVVVRSFGYRFSIGHTRGGSIDGIAFGDGEMIPVTMSDEAYSGNLRSMIWYAQNPKITVIESGPQRATVVVETQLRGEQFLPIRVVYAYTIWANSPLVRVRAYVPPQPTDAQWRWLSLINIGLRPASGLTSVASGDPPTLGALAESEKTQTLVTMTGLGMSKQWGALLDGRGNALGIIGPELGGIFGTKAAATLTGPNRGAWHGEEVRWTGYLYVGDGREGGARVGEFAKLVPLIVAHDRAADIEAAAESIRQSLAKESNSVRAAVARGLADLALEHARGSQPERARQLLSLAKKAASSDANTNPLVIDSTEGVVVANEEISLCWVNADGVLQLAGIQNVRHGHQFRRPGGDRESPIWACTMASPDGTRKHAVASDHPARFVHEIKRDGDAVELALEWRGCPIADAHGTLDARATVRLAKSDPLSRWRLRIDPKGSDVGPWSIEFPVVGSLGVARDSAGAHEQLAACLKQGTLHESPSSGIKVGDWYPSGYFSQFMTYWCGPSGPDGIDDPRAASNLYLATYDADSNLKGFFTRPDGLNSFAMYVEHQPPGMGVAGQSFETNYDAIVGSFSGDWYDACQVYRQWATKQVWCSHGTVDVSNDIPDWFKKNVLTFRPSGPPEVMVPKMLRLHEFFGPDLPSFTNWYEGTWDTKHIFSHLPTLLPGRADLDSTLATLAKNDMRVVAYSCLEMWADDHPDFKTRGLASATIEPDGTPKHIEWKPGHQVLPCPAAAEYQVEQTKAIVDAVKAHDIKGVYLDLLSCAPYPCYSTSHGHARGGGDWWVKGYRKICGDIRSQARAVEPEFVMFGEANGECFLDLRDSCVLFHGLLPSLTPVNLPMYQVIFGDYTMTYGPHTGGFNNPPVDAWPSIANFMYGGMVGRIFDDSLIGTPIMDHWKTLARYRKACLNYFIGARVLRPQAIRYVSEPRSELKRSGMAILSTVRRATDGSVALMFGNCTLGVPAIEFEYTIDPAELGFRSGSIEIQPVTLDAPRPAPEVLTGKVSRRLALPPATVAIFTLRPN